MTDDVHDDTERDAALGGDVEPEADTDRFARWFDREFDTGDVERTDAASTVIDRRDAGTERRHADPAHADPADADPAPTDHGGVVEPERERSSTRDAARLDTGEPAGATPARNPLFGRAIGRVARRPLAWWNRPWTNERVVRVVVTSTALVATTVIMMMVVHFNPLSPSRDLILDDTTPTGGDMGAHVWAPAFLRDHLLPGGQISGWSMDWYGGLPLYRFYMVIPALAIIALDAVPFVAYGVAFKIVAMSGLITFPLACWAFGRLAAFRHPIPELFAFGGVAFLLDESFDIYGGNVKSTMAGEYSFSIALTLAVLGLGLLANGLRTGKYRVWTAVVLSLAAVSHGIVLIFVAVSALVICLVWIDRTRLWYALTTGVTLTLLSAWWVGPFLLGHEFMTDMKYGFRPNSATDSFWDMYFPLTPALDILIMSLAVIGFITMVVRRQLTGTALGLISVLFAVLVWNTRESLPVIGLLWNPRLLPFFYLVRYLLMVIGALEIIAWFVNMARSKLANRTLGAYEGAGAFVVVGVSMLLVFGWMYEVLPGDGTAVEATDDGEQSVYSWGPFHKGASSGRAVADSWTRYNWTGYEGRPAYPAYNYLISTMDRVGENRGCGRALWENNGDNSEYGTTMALMLLPHWTDGCIGSMEGLFFEATASTNYHFLTTAAVSESSSNPVRQLRYTNNDADLGVRHMRDLGVRYMMVRTDAAKDEAATADGLEYVTTSGTWDIYEVGGSNIVEPLTVEPVVVDQSDASDWYKPADDRERNLELGTSWFQNPDDWPAVPVDDGPQEWQRVTARIVEDERIEPFDDQSRKVDYVEPTAPITPTPLPTTTVTDVEIRQQSLSFSVDQVGVPVIVKVSYFPNWNVSGAEGPFRAGANHMIVVPTSTDVELTYDSRAALDWFFYALTAFGIALCLLWRRRGDVVHAGPVPSLMWSRRNDPDVDDDDDDDVARTARIDDGDEGARAAWARGDRDDPFGSAHGDVDDGEPHGGAGWVAGDLTPIAFAFDDDLDDEREARPDPDPPDDGHPPATA